MLLHRLVAAFHGSLPSFLAARLPKTFALDPYM
jgi:hypothetical protein